MTTQTGLTLIELLISMAILSIVSLAAIPMAHHESIGRKVDRSAEQLSHLIRYARSEALFQGVSVIICPTDDQKHCGGRWEQGQLVFLDSFDQGQLLSVEQILQVGAPIKMPVELSLRAFSRGDFLRFTPNGYEQQSNGTFLLSAKGGNKVYRRTLIINQAGRMRLAD